jgi:hypothetical protein
MFNVVAHALLTYLKGVVKLPMSAFDDLPKLIRNF